MKMNMSNSLAAILTAVINNTEAFFQVFPCFSNRFSLFFNDADPRLKLLFFQSQGRQISPVHFERVFLYL